MNSIKFVTLGCKVNQYETQAMRELALKKDLREESGRNNDVVVINTCTVTGEADRQNKYWIRRLRRENPCARIVVTGCWVERNRPEVENLAGVDLVLSNREKHLLGNYLLEGCATPAVQDRQQYTPLSISSFPGRGRAFIKIQDGCNHACSFCKVVLVRGRSRSRLLEEIVEEAGRLSEAGFREVVLSGIQLGAYGTDLHPQLSLIPLLEELSLVPGIERIRLSSIEPTDVKEELIEAMIQIPKVCPQLHIPLQSGDDEILKKMNRRYDRNFYSSLICRLRDALPDFCLSMDVMAGFPGEEEKHFQNTLSLVEETGPIRIHAFPYSRREETRAARWEGLPEPVIRERMKRLNGVSADVALREKQKFVGRTLPVLVETKLKNEELYEGHTPHYLKVHFAPHPSLSPQSRERVGVKGDLLGRTVPVRLTEIAGDALMGVVDNGGST